MMCGENSSFALGILPASRSSENAPRRRPHLEALRRIHGPSAKLDSAWGIFGSKAPSAPRAHAESRMKMSRGKIVAIWTPPDAFVRSRKSVSLVAPHGLKRDWLGSASLYRSGRRTAPRVMMRRTTPSSRGSQRQEEERERSISRAKHSHPNAVAVLRHVRSSRACVPSTGPLRENYKVGFAKGEGENCTAS